MWTNAEKHYYLGARRVVDRLNPSIYRLTCDDQNGLFLTHVQDTFPLPVKMYGLDTLLIEHVTTVVEKTNKNIGVLLAGLKGAGKTITAKQLCNLLIGKGLSVILITHAYPGIAEFLNDINEHLVVFIDEYEKIFTHQSKNALLTVMDGALDNGNRRIFLLTSNDIYVNPNLMERTGRIRYIRKYDDLKGDLVLEIINDTLIHKHLIDETVKFISTLETITIDIVLSVVEEVNIFGKSPNTFKDIFNVKVNDDYCDIYEKDGDVALFKSVRIQIYNSRSIGESFKSIGKIVAVLDKDTFVVQEQKTGRELAFVQRPTLRLHRSFRTEIDENDKDDMEGRQQKESGWDF